MLRRVLDSEPSCLGTRGTTYLEEGIQTRYKDLLQAISHRHTSLKRLKKGKFTHGSQLSGPLMRSLRHTLNSITGAVVYARA